MTTASGLNELVENHEIFLKKAYESGVKIQIVAPINKQTVETAKSITKYAQLRNIENVEKMQKVLGNLLQRVFEYR